MASRQIIVLALICFAVIGMASAAAPAQPAAAAGAPSDDIGTTDGNEDAAPVGAPVPAGTFSQTSESPSGSPGSSAASGLQVSTIAGFAATAVGAAFFF